MAAQLLAYEVADLCLGKPPLRSLSASTATVSDALAALKSADENSISVWNCDHRRSKNPECVCVGKICMVDIICYLCREENLASPAAALKSPISVLLSKFEGLVRHVEPSSSLIEAIDLILEGAQNLVVPIRTNSRQRKQLQKSSNSPSLCSTNHNGQEYCWLTQEDIIRFLLGLIGLFSPIPTLSVETLNLISHDYLVVDYHAPATSAIGPIYQSLVDQTSVAVIDDGGTLIGEISPFTLACCDETVAAAIMTLSAGDLMAYIDCGGPPEEIVRVVEERLKEKNLECLLDEFVSGSCNGNSSSDEELAPLARMGWYTRCSSYSARMVRRAEAIVCHPGSSLVAVMIQAIAHRVNYVWVIDNESGVVGIVTFANMLEVFRENLEPMI
ncbi:hypothetical protein CASFOL_008041 [Castilleja foliolosa]|uniref:CBS domain-containing protein n=1 Tax=Castilleja foliolosa TaxID=1961234 RepID=A0ABD3DY59_9LAMI